VAENPVMEYCKFIVFERLKKDEAFDIRRPEKFGGNVSFANYAELEEAYSQGKIHPMDLKAATSEHVNRLLEPVRNHFEKNAKARQLLEDVRKLEVTR
jgi:tyrosyl-tRNA synthetase